LPAPITSIYLTRVSAAYRWVVPTWSRLSARLAF
jgi:hypothetical protein